MSVEVHTDLVQRVCRYIEATPDTIPTLAEMGDHVGMKSLSLAARVQEADRRLAA